MAGIVGWHEGALTRALDQGPATAGLEVVLAGTEQVEPLEDGDVGPGPGGAVIALGAGAGRAGRRGGGGGGGLPGGPLGGGGGAARAGRPHPGPDRGPD